MTNDIQPQDPLNDDEYTPIPGEMRATEAHASPDDLHAFEEQTLSQALSRFLREPGQTWALLRAVTEYTGRRPPPTEAPPADDDLYPPDDDINTRSTTLAPTVAHDEADEPDAQPDAANKASFTASREEVAGLLSVRITLMLIAWVGNSMTAAAGLNNNGNNVTTGVFILLAVAAAWLALEAFAHRRGLRAWWVSLGGSDTPTTPDELFYEAPTTSRAEKRPAFIDRIGIHPVRVVLFVFGVGALLLTVAFTQDNQFTMIGFFAWMVSIIALAGSLATDDFLFNAQPSRGIPRFWKSGTFYALLAIMVVGLVVRTANLDRTPPQMTSDHVEKLLDAQRVLDGTTQVFFPNNGGREAFQMYAMAVLASVPGLDIDFTTLKLLSALEGVITLPFLWWMGRAIIGEEDRQLGNLLGLTLAGLVAVSGWHLALSRLALRIVLTPLITAWLLVYLSRAMRRNHRDDYLKAGLVLGAGLYMYQAVRMLPLVVIAGVLIAVIVNVRSWARLRAVALNFGALVFTSFIVFVPLFAFSLQFPDLFWRRTAGRLLGDAIIQETAADGTITLRETNFSEQLATFQANLPILWNNILDALAMFNYKGDVAWINNFPNAPQMDMLVGGLFVVGLAAWTVRIIQRRDSVDMLVPVAMFIMLLPSALSIAYPVENPSATRTSGALPTAYLLAAYPLALMMHTIWRLGEGRRVTVAVNTGLVALVMAISLGQNSQTYFQKYHNNYLMSSLPYAQAGTDLRVFNFEVGTAGNTFMIAYPYWWDHRALGLEAGLVDYPNGIVTLDDVPGFLYESFLRSGRYELDPTADMLFFFSVDDVEALGQLQEWFPNGQANFTTIESQNRSYGTYRVPALGMEGFTVFMRDTNAAGTTNE